MLLTKDESKLLRAYYLKITKEKGLEKVTIEKWYQVSDLIEMLRSRNIKKAIRKLPDSTVSNAISSGQNEFDIGIMRKEVPKYLRDEKRVNITNDTLEKQGLISVRYGPPQGKGKISDWRGISLTIEGWNLGRQYNSWYYKTGGFWWAEYKGHWIWSIVAAIISFILGWLAKGASQ